MESKLLLQRTSVINLTTLQKKKFKYYYILSEIKKKITSRCAHIVIRSSRSIYRQYYIIIIAFCGTYRYNLFI